MSLHVEIRGRQRLELDALLLDVNGTLSDRGALIEGVGGRITALKSVLGQITLLSADTFGTLDAIASDLDVPWQRISSGDEKLAFLRRAGAERCVAIGNGANDASMLAAAGLGIAVLGPEGLNVEALQAADLVCGSVGQALDLLLDPRALAATLRS
jgi:soluble P-type ATPase